MGLVNAHASCTPGVKVNSKRSSVNIINAFAKKERS